MMRLALAAVWLGALAVSVPGSGRSAGQTQAALPADEVASFTAAWNAAPRVDVNVPAGGAKVLIVMFVDFQCPTCRQAHETYQPVLAKFQGSNPGAVKVVLKDWPLNAKCNFNVTTTAHPAACEAAVAVRIARDLDKEDAMESWLFANQQTMGPDDVKAAAARILGVTDFDAQYAKRIFDVRSDVADGGVLQIRGTPTVFINGVRVEQLMPAPYFELAVALELKRSGMPGAARTDGR